MHEPRNQDNSTNRRARVLGTVALQHSDTSRELARPLKQKFDPSGAAEPSKQPYDGAVLIGEMLVSADKKCLHCQFVTMGSPQIRYRSKKGSTTAPQMLLLAGLSYRQLGPDSPAPTPSCGETRTAAGIIWSCLSMIILCTWTSVRPNVPSVPRSGHEALVYWDNIKIFLIALIAPEFIVLWSIRQWFAAREMVKEYSKHDWTMTHAFFCSHGRICIESCGTQLRKLEELHPHGHGDYKSSFEFCVANGLVIMTGKEIESLGHTDLLAKTIAIFQTLYFITNCIARGVKGLAIN
ncbi:hypothetical protein PM082_017567 [Marasmius tenuissimus]|nr:hypothetical protein PM082_017567 [Marasmius tenuissimus]